MTSNSIINISGQFYHVDVYHFTGNPDEGAPEPRRLDTSVAIRDALATLALSHILQNTVDLRDRTVLHIADDGFRKLTQDAFNSHDFRLIERHRAEALGHLSSEPEILREFGRPIDTAKDLWDCIKSKLLSRPNTNDRAEDTPPVEHRDESPPNPRAPEIEQPVDPTGAGYAYTEGPHDFEEERRVNVAEHRRREATMYNFVGNLSEPRTQAALDVLYEIYNRETADVVHTPDSTSFALQILSSVDRTLIPNCRGDEDVIRFFVGYAKLRHGNETIEEFRQRLMREHFEVRMHPANPDSTA